MARRLGTVGFLAAQTAVVAIWITFNTLRGTGAFDPYPYVLLNLCFSVQAAYAAPLVLGRQRRQATRDRAARQADQDVALRAEQEVRFLTKELSLLRLAAEGGLRRSELDDGLHQLQVTVERRRRRGQPT